MVPMSSIPILIFMTRSIYTHAADCGPVSSPPSGHVSPYSSTLEGATVAFTYMCENNVNGQSFSLDGTAVCNQNGNWEPNPANSCGKSSGINNETFLTCIYIAGPLIIGYYFLFRKFICGSELQLWNIYYHCLINFCVYHQCRSIYQPWICLWILLQSMA
jgi:hypothetical protein